MPRNLFKKGISGNPGGRPKGIQNKNFLSLQYWFGIISENVDRLSPERKIEIAKECAQMLLAKVQAVPAALTPLPGAITDEDKISALEASVSPPLPPQDGPPPPP